MNFVGALKNPVVLGGGALLGVILLLRSGPANANTTAAMNAVNPTYTSAAVAMNSAALGAQIQMAQVSANLGATAYAADVQKQLGFYSLIKSIDDNNAMIENVRATTNAGVTNNLIASSAALVIDQSNNANRLALGEQAVHTAQIQADASVDVAKLQADAAKAVSHNSMIGNIVGGFTNVLAHTIPLAIGG